MRREQFELVNLSKIDVSDYVEATFRVTNPKSDVRGVLMIKLCHEDAVRELQFGKSYWVDLTPVEQ